MPKTLTRTPPTSSVAKMLESGVGAHVTAKPEGLTPQMLPTPVQTLPEVNLANQDVMRASGEIPNVPRQFTLTLATDRILKRVVSAYSEATGLDLKHSEWLRGVLVACEHAMPELIREAREIGPLRRPKNDRGREAEREQLERRIAKAFIAGLRATALLG